MKISLIDFPKLVDPIIVDLVEKGGQNRIEKAVKARGLLVEFSNLIGELGIYREPDCEGVFSDCDHTCKNFERCARDNERYMRLIGRWAITDEVA